MFIFFSSLSYPFSIPIMNIFFFIFISSVSHQRPNLIVINKRYTHYFTLVVLIYLWIVTINIFAINWYRLKSNEYNFVYNEAKAVDGYAQIEKALSNNNFFKYDYATTLINLGFYKGAFKWRSN